MTAYSGVSNLVEGHGKRRADGDALFPVLRFDRLYPLDRHVVGDYGKMSYTHIYIYMQYVDWSTCSEGNGWASLRHLILVREGGQRFYGHGERWPFTKVYMDSTYWPRSNCFGREAFPSHRWVHLVPTRESGDSQDGSFHFCVVGDPPWSECGPYGAILEPTVFELSRIVLTRHNRFFPETEHRPLQNMSRTFRRR